MALLYATGQHHLNGCSKEPTVAAIAEFAPWSLAEIEGYLAQLSKN
jgi:hypothetical protein